MFLLTRLIRCCKATPACMKTVAPDFWDSVNPYNRHFFKPALQVAQRALCLQATLAVAVFASYHFTVQKQLWWERLLVYIFKKKKKKATVICWLPKHHDFSQAVSRGLLSNRYGEKSLFSVRSVKTFWTFLHYFQDKVQTECAVKLLKIKITFSSLSCILLVYSLSGRNSYQKISWEAIGVKWNWFGNGEEGA